VDCTKPPEDDRPDLPQMLRNVANIKTEAKEDPSSGTNNNGVSKEDQNERKRKRKRSVESDSTSPSSSSPLPHGDSTAGTETADKDHSSENNPKKHAPDPKQNGAAKPAVPSKKIFKCEICGKALSSKQSLKNHELSHSTVPQFPCTVCNKSFNTKRLLSVHQRSHLKVVPFQCHRCQETRSFANKSVLQQHNYRKHRDAFDLVCDKCKKCFTDAKDFDKHMQRHLKSKDAEAATQ